MNKIWVLCDDRAGNVNQALGVAEKLEQPFERKDIQYNAFAKLPNFLLGSSMIGIDAESKKAFSDTNPDLIISAGRRTAPIARAIKKRSKSQTKLVQIMYPGDAGVDDFDLIAIPDHDDLNLPNNAISITGAPHRVSSEKLSDARDIWMPRFDHLSGPKIALIIGGATKDKTFEKDQALKLCQQVNHLAKEMNASVLITTSRRTGELADLILSEITVPKFTFKWGDEGENPYFGFLTCADYVIVSGDSVSMCCEATQSPGAVHIFAPDTMISDKHKRLHDSLYAGGYAVPFEGTLSSEKGPTLNSADQIASVIKKRFL